MAQYPSDPEDYIDVDATLVRPSPNRVRNILTLEERVAAIQAYYCRPMYTKVARMFNCSWEQIKNIVVHREAIMEFYEATKGKEKMQREQQKQHLQLQQQHQQLLRNSYQHQQKRHGQHEYRYIDGGSRDDYNAYEGMDLKQRKLKFLGECMYEYIQRVQYHACQDITEELLRMKALEFRDIMNIPDFYPNKQWFNQFKAVYNISLANRQIMLTRVPPSSLDLKDIMTYCSKSKANRMKTYNPSLTEIKELQQNRQQQQQQRLEQVAQKAANLLSDPNIEDVEEKRRIRKLNFLEKALAEYIHRAKFHHKCIQLNYDTLIKVARELNEILKIHQFVPTHNWLQEFQKRQDEIQKTKSQQQQHQYVGRPLLSLDLKDILSYCSRMDNKDRAPTITLTPKHPTLHYTYRVKTPPPMNLKFPNSAIKFKNDSIIYLDEDENLDEVNEQEDQDQEGELKDIKPDIEETKLQPVAAPPSFSVTSSSTTHIPISNNHLAYAVSPLQRPPPPSSPSIKIRRIESINADATVELVTKIKQEDHADHENNNDSKYNNNNNSNNSWRPQLCGGITKDVSQQEKQKNLVTIRCNKVRNDHHQHHNETDKNKNGISNENDILSYQVKNRNDALRLLKPLEEYAMLEENYRAIGLIAQLEDIFKNTPNNDGSNDDET